MSQGLRAVEDIHGAPRHKREVALAGECLRVDRRPAGTEGEGRPSRRTPRPATRDEAGDYPPDHEHDDEAAEHPTATTKSPRLTDKCLGVGLVDLGRFDLRVEERHDTAWIIAMTSSGW